MISANVWNMKPVVSALQKIMQESGAVRAVDTPLYESDKKLPWWCLLLSMPETKEPLQILKDYPTNWAYVTITYRIKDTTVYVETISYRIAGD